MFLVRSQTLELCHFFDIFWIIIKLLENTDIYLVFIFLKDEVNPLKTAHVRAFAVRCALCCEEGNWRAYSAIAENRGNNKLSQILFPGFFAILYVVTPSQHKAQHTANARTYAVLNRFTSFYQRINTKYISLIPKSFIMIQQISKKWHSSKVWLLTRNSLNFRALVRVHSYK